MSRTEQIKAEIIALMDEERDEGGLPGFTPNQMRWLMTFSEAELDDLVNGERHIQDGFGDDHA